MGLFELRHRLPDPVHRFGRRGVSREQRFAPPLANHPEGVRRPLGIRRTPLGRFNLRQFSATGITERSKCGQELALGIGSRTPSRPALAGKFFRCLLFGDRLMER